MISKAYIEISLNSNEEKFTLTFLGLILKLKKFEDEKIPIDILFRVRTKFIKWNISRWNFK